MRLISLEVENFGIFTRRHFHFGDGHLALVYGANETGKSTLLQLLREVLFGFPHRDTIPNDTGQIVGRATLELSDGRLLAWHRRKGRINPLSGYLLEDGTQWEEAQLIQLLAGASPELYQHVFAFSLSELQLGEKSLQTAKLTETLYGGGTGGLAAFRRIEAAIHDRLEKLFSPRASVRTINQQIKKIRECSKLLRDASIRPGTFEQQAGQCAEAQQHLDRCATRVQQLTDQMQRLQRRAQIQPARKRRDILAKGLADLRLPSSIKLEQVEELFTAVEQLIAVEQELTRLRAEQTDRRNRRAGIDIDPKLLVRSDDVLQLYSDLRRIAGCRRDCPLRSEEALSLEKEIDRQLARWRPDWNQQFLRQLSLGQAELKSVREMADQQSALDRKQAEADAAFRAQLRQLTDSCARLAKLIPAARHDRSTKNSEVPEYSALMHEHLQRLMSELSECEAVHKSSANQGLPTEEELFSARHSRDQKWTQLKASLTNGRSAPRVTDLEEYESLVKRCDQLADRLRSEAADKGAREAQLQRERFLRQELASAQITERELEKLQQQIDQLKQQRIKWQQRWKELLALWQLPDQWTPQLADQILNELFELKQRLERADSLHQRVQEMQREIQQFANATKQVCEDVAVDLLGLEPDAAVRSLYQRMQQMSTETKLSGELDQQLGNLEVELKNAATRREGLLARLGSLSIESAEELPKWHARLRQAGDLWTELQSIDQLLLSLVEDAERESDQGENANEMDWTAECQSLRLQLDEAKRQHTAAMEQAVSLNQRVEDLDTQNRSNELALELEQHRAELRSAIDEWAPLKLASALMTHCLEVFERERQPKLLQSASVLFHQMTEGKYVEVRRRLGEEESLIVQQFDGREKHPSQLSSGTREQLYLAIRLAYVLQYCEQAEPLPVVMDDVLVNFDARRARATLEVLHSISKRVQILLMTCHETTARMVMQAAGHLTRIDLGEPLGDVEPRPTPVPPRKRPRLAPAAAADREVQRPLFPPQ